MALTKEEQLELVKSVLEGDQQACATLHRQYHSTVRKALQMVPMQDRDDEAQNAFTLVFSKLGQFNGDAALSTWIHRVSYNVGLVYLRKKKQKKAGNDTLSLDDTMEGDHGEVKRLIEPGDEDPRHRNLHARDLVARLLAGASPSDRFVLEKMLEGHGANSLAEMTGQSLTAIKSRMFNTRKRAQNRALDFSKDPAKQGGSAL